MGLVNIQPLSRALTGNSWHGRFHTVVFSANDPSLIEKYKTLQTFPVEYVVNVPKTWATKYIANAVPPLAVANWILRNRLDDYIPRRISLMVDLFAGIGGWALALCYYLRYRINRIIAIDIDKRALMLYKLNIERLCGIKVDTLTRDIMSLNTLPDSDIVVMSPPCESVSSANIMNTTCEPAVSLTKKALALVESINPRLTLYEEAPTKHQCRGILIEILRKHNFYTQYVNLMNLGSLNSRKRLLAFMVSDLNVKTQEDKIEVMGYDS